MSSEHAGMSPSSRSIGPAARVFRSRLLAIFDRLADGNREVPHALDGTSYTSLSRRDQVSTRNLRTIMSGSPAEDDARCRGRTGPTRVMRTSGTRAIAVAGQAEDPPAVGGGRRLHGAAEHLRHVAL